MDIDYLTTYMFVIKKIKIIKNSQGFSLIELLVVIAIIGVLASIIANSLIISRLKANDAKRQEELKQMKTALAQYAADNNDEYPDPDGANPANTCTSADTAQAGCIFATTDGDNPLKPEYMSSVVKTLDTKTYTYNQNVDEYAAYVELEAYTPTLYFCIDSAGKSETTTNVPAGTACP